MSFEANDGHIMKKPKRKIIVSTKNVTKEVGKALSKQLKYAYFRALQEVMSSAAVTYA